MSCTPSHRILIVDDDPQVLRLLAAMLGRKGHAVIAASSGAQAVELFEKHSFQLLITDMAMPSMTGMQLSLAFKRRFPSVPVLMLTADPSQVAPEAAATPACIDLLLQKPASINSINQAVHQLMGRS